MPRAMERPCRAQWYATTSAAPITRAALTVTSSGSPGPTPTPNRTPVARWAPLVSGAIMSSLRCIGDRVDGGRGHGAAAPAAVHDQVRQTAAGQGLLALRGADEAHRNADHGGRPGCALRDQGEQPEQRGGRVADGDHRAIHPFTPQV